jgi:uncharacterized membrane protein
MSQARKSLANKWGIAIGSWLVFFILTSLSFNISIWEWQGDNGGNYKSSLDIISWIITGPISLGYASIILLIAKKQNPDFAFLFSGFKRFGVSLATYLVMIVFIILWMLLFIIPGIIACLRYAQTWYILSEDENISAMDAIRKSKEMMIGNKWKLFCLYFRFIGWIILCVITLGLAGLYVGPYMSVSCAKFYEDIKIENSAQKTDIKTSTTETILNETLDTKEKPKNLSENYNTENNNTEES